MPGMMDTVLNLGLNDTIVEGLAKQVGAKGLHWGHAGPGANSWDPRRVAPYCTLLPELALFIPHSVLQLVAGLPRSYLVRSPPPTHPSPPPHAPGRQ
jgi:hypothetical protein